MSKRPPAAASKRARTPKIPAKAQRAKPAVVKSPKLSVRRVVQASPAESPSKAHNTSEQAAPGFEIAAAAFQAVPLLENPMAAHQTDRKPAMTNGASNKGFDFSSATTNLQAYQAKFLDMALANMQFAFEFAQRLATIRSPLDILGVTAELAGKRIALLQKYA
jgi:ribosomal protein S30